MPIYKALLDNWYDGDTCTVDIYLGLGIVLKKQTIRLYGIDTPEIRGDEKVEGKIVRDFVRSCIPGGTWCVIDTDEKRCKYGRLLGLVYDQNGICINDLLLKKGMAVKMLY